MTLPLDYSSGHEDRDNMESNLELRYQKEDTIGGGGGGSGSSCGCGGGSSGGSGSDGGSSGGSGDDDDDSQFKNGLNTPWRYSISASIRKQNYFCLV